jgi:hypothetical protein
MANVRTSRDMVLAILGLAVLVSCLLQGGDAQAQHWRKDFYYDSYEGGPRARGYEGFLLPDYYCSYRRYPIRACSTDKRGRKRCRVKGWRIEQTCQ